MRTQVLVRKEESLRNVSQEHHTHVRTRELTGSFVAIEGWMPYDDRADMTILLSHHSWEEIQYTDLSG